MTFKNILKGYRIVFFQGAEKDLEKIEKHYVEKIKEKLGDLVDGKQNVDIDKLEGQNDPAYRLRCGRYRVVYEVHEHTVIVFVIEMKHRKEVYRNW